MQDGLQQATRKLWGVMDRFIILIVMLDSHIYTQTQAKIYHLTYFKYVQ